MAHKPETIFEHQISNDTFDTPKSPNRYKSSANSCHHIGWSHVKTDWWSFFFFPDILIATSIFLQQNELQFTHCKNPELTLQILFVMHIHTRCFLLSSVWRHAPFSGPSGVVLVSEVRDYHEFRQCFWRAALSIDQGGTVSRNISPRAALCLVWTATKFEQNKPTSVWGTVATCGSTVWNGLGSEYLDEMMTWIDGRSGSKKLFSNSNWFSKQIKKT